MIQELNQWHFQCLHPRLDPAKAKKYTSRFNDFIEEMWSSSNEEGEPQLEVAQVENCADKAGQPSAVRVSRMYSAGSETIPLTMTRFDLG